jgi:membrane-bound lytic murein transglycosylase D
VTSAPVDPDRGAARRSVGAATADASDTPSAKPDPDAAASDKPKSHRTGTPPRKPSPTLPPGAPRASTNATARRTIAGGLTDEDIDGGANDPELRALKAADKVLFPKPLRGVAPGWAWDLPRPTTPEAVELEASGLPPDAAIRATGEPASKADAEWLRGLVMPNLPVRLESRVVRYLKFYRDTARGRSIARVWAKKSGRYIPAMKQEFARAGLPTDLVWLSLIESGHNPTIVSPVGAAGLWQFMPEAGRLYGLTVDRWVDERLDPERSTQAAIRYLGDLHRRFGNWELAMAAYNMGYGGLSRAIRKFNTNDFWELSRYEAGVPWETTLYVPKIFAIAVVMANPKAFGVADVTADQPASFDTVQVNPGVSLEQIARAADVSSKAIAELNPSFLAARVPPSRPGELGRRWPVRVPTGKGRGCNDQLAKQDGGGDAELEPYLTRAGDSCGSVASGRGINEADLRRINGMSASERLNAGTVLLVPRRASGVAAPPPATAEDVVVVPPRQFSYPKRRRVFYRVASGDTLSRIAKAFDVSRAELTTWNALDPSARLHSGMVLQVFSGESQLPRGVHVLKESDVRVLVAGTQAFFDYFEGLNNKKRIVVTVREGDTLSAIGKRYGMSVGQMERVNRRSRAQKLRPGDQIVVYAARNTPGNRDEPEPFEPSPLAMPDAPRPDVLPPLAD